MVSTVATLNENDSSIREGLKKGNWYASGRWWLLWEDQILDSSMIASSADGITWTAPNAFFTNNRAYKHSAMYYNGKMYFVCASYYNGPKGTFWRSDCNADGSITVLNMDTIPQNPNDILESYDNVCVDSSGTVRISFAGSIGPNYVPFLVNWLGPGNWTFPVATAPSYILSNTTLPMALAGNLVAILYNDSSIVPKMAIGNSPYVDASPLPHLPFFSYLDWCAVSDRDKTIFMVYSTGVGIVRSVWLRKYYVGIGWGAPLLITSGAIGGLTGTDAVCPRVTIDGLGRPFVVWVENHRAIYYVGIVNGTGTSLGLVGLPTLIYDEGAGAAVDNVQLPEITNVNGDAGVFWTNGLNIRFESMHPVYTPLYPPIPDYGLVNALENIPSSVRVGTYTNRRTRRGACGI